MDKFLQRLLTKTQESPLGKGVMDYLAARRATPEIKTGYLGDAVSGEYAQNGFYGNELPKNGRITLSSGYENFDQIPSQQAAGTLAHELTHAETEQLGWQSHKGEKQFKDAYRKLGLDIHPPKGQEVSQPQEMARRLAPEWLAQNRDYRASSGELPSFAVGNMVSGDPTRPGPPHVDSTLATERAILQEIALRDILKQPPKGR